MAQKKYSFTHDLEIINEVIESFKFHPATAKIIKTVIKTKCETALYLRDFYTIAVETCEECKNSRKS